MQPCITYMSADWQSPTAAGTFQEWSAAGHGPPSAMWQQGPRELTCLSQLNPSGRNRA